MVISKPTPVTVLWDLETCPANDTSAEDAATLVSSVATAHGNIRTFKAFYLPDWGDRAAGLYLQSLQRKGVDTVDSSFLTGDSVEKAMTIEMLTDAIDGGFHAPPTIILISQSASLEYAVAKLRNKNYKVFVFKSWDELREQRSTAMTPPATPLAPTSSAGDTAVITRSDPMSVMGHLDPVVQQMFHVLIEALWASIEDGEDRVSRANIGNIMIRRDANVYREAQFFGNNAFKNYIATAEQKGVIRCGGGGTEAWVELRTSGAGNSAGPGAN